MKKLLRQTEKIYYLIFAAALLYGCGKDEPTRDYVARVDNSYLTEQDINAVVDTNRIEPAGRNEYIRNWIETEIYYQEAIKEDITENEEYNRILTRTRKELAKSFLIKKILSETEFDYNQTDLEDFYLSNKEEFKVFYETYLYNMIVFNDEDKAVLFRNTLVESDWNRTANVFRGDPSILREQTGILQSYYKIQPYTLYLMLQNLMPDEVSIILNMEPSDFTIVQLLKRYEPNDIPEFDVVKKDVEEKYIMQKRREFLKDYQKEIYTNYKIEIK